MCVLLYPLLWNPSTLFPRRSPIKPVSPLACSLMNNRLPRTAQMDSPHAPYTETDLGLHSNLTGITRGTTWQLRVVAWKYSHIQTSLKLRRSHHWRLFECFFPPDELFTHPISEWYKCDHALYGKPFKWHFSKFYSQQTNSTPPTLYHDHTVINTQYNNNSN